MLKVLSLNDYRGNFSIRVFASSGEALMTHHKSVPAHQPRLLADRLYTRQIHISAMDMILSSPPVPLGDQQTSSAGI
jgi:hypothetical protein